MPLKPERMWPSHGEGTAVEHWSVLLYLFRHSLFACWFLELKTPQKTKRFSQNRDIRPDCRVNGGFSFFSFRSSVTAVKSLESCLWVADPLLPVLKAVWFEMLMSVWEKRNLMKTNYGAVREAQIKVEFNVLCSVNLQVLSMAQCCLLLTSSELTWRLAPAKSTKLDM